MTTLTQKGQTTIPKNVREMLSLRPGDEVEFDVEGDAVVIHKKKKKLPLDKWVGYLGKFSSDKALKELR